jgi:hypothetical protein
MKEIDPYAATPNPESAEINDMSRPSNLPVNHKNIDVRAFGSAGYGNEKSDDPRMYS